MTVIRVYQTIYNRVARILFRVFQDRTEKTVIGVRVLDSLDHCRMDIRGGESIQFLLNVGAGVGIARKRVGTGIGDDSEYRNRNCKGNLATVFVAWIDRAVSSSERGGHGLRGLQSVYRSVEVPNVSCIQRLPTSPARGPGS